MFSLESPHRGDSNVYTQYTIFVIKKKTTPDYSKSAAMGFFPRDSKNEVETAVVNESSVFEPLKFYCISTIFFFFKTSFCEQKLKCFQIRVISVVIFQLLSGEATLSCSFFSFLLNGGSTLRKKFAPLGANSFL